LTDRDIIFSLFLCMEQYAFHLCSHQSPACQMVHVEVFQVHTADHWLAEAKMGS